ncbi:fimbria/pilus outer membrane usher protein [Serratia ficaria]|uniref:fimbria/pilus outer membrane usher protein n=1 Tax=Serratia ficaria TaxID=61651 RepID=UPI0021C74365|nr:fimbria/pilus outer membrane usher protein [Serratia ficaria]
MKVKNILNYSGCMAGVLLAVMPFSSVYARVWSFDATQLAGDEQNVDIAIFEQGGQLPGRYFVDIVLNGEHVDSREMIFHMEKDAEGAPTLKTCLTRGQLIGYGVNVDAYADLFTSSGKMPGQCARLSVIPQATEVFQFNSQQLRLSIPQVAMSPKLRGIAPPVLWDDGAPAFLMNYQTNATRSDYRGYGQRHSDALFARVDPGINLGAWRLRNMTTFQKSGNRPGKWQTADTWAERGLYGLQSRLTLGERYTPSDIFNSVPFRGGMLGSDDLMVPYNQRDFAPLVRGIARTQARIEVRQGGYVIYSSTVAPGAFALSDLPAGSNGDLQVTVYETDGRPQVFTVPWSTPAIALRQGYLRYNLMSGQYRPENRAVKQAPVAQATLMYGLPWNLTSYGGVQWSEHYQSAALGLGVLLGDMGALSLDGMQGYGAEPDGHRTQGQTWRLRYNKTLAATNTGISLASSQYSASGGHSMNEVLDRWQDKEYASGGRFHRWDDRRRKARSDVTIGQSFDYWGYLSVSASRESYWDSPQTRDEMTASWSTSSWGINWSVNWTQRKQPAWGSGTYGRHYQSEQEGSLWISVPLDRWTGGNAYATYQAQSNSDGRVRHEVGLTGNAFERQLDWNVRQQLEQGGGYDRQSGGLVNLTWNGAYGVLNGGYSYNENSRQSNAGLAGGVVVHQHGITLGQPLGRTTALVAAPGVAGVSVGSWAGVRTDFRGYAMQTGLTPYQENTVELDPLTLPQDAEVPQIAMRLVPTEGAVIPARFTARIGARAVVALQLPGGKPVPFGALATLGSDRSTGSGIVGESGQVYLSGLPDSGELDVRWGDGKRCHAAFHLPEKKGPAGIYNLQSQCR